MCEELQNPTNGQVSMTGQSIGSTATYTCDSSYELVGDEVRRCVDGEWTGQEPTCIRVSLPQTAYTIIILFYLPELCDELSDPTNGGVIWSTLTEGSVATYHCDNGYELIGDDTRRCVDGEWTGQEPTCSSI